jgi:ribosome-associated translation inhibitor RaiA
MDLPLQIATRGFELSPPDEQGVRDAAAKLELFASSLMSCRVMLELQSRRRRTGDRYHVRIELVVPGGEIVIKRQSDETLLSATQEAFKAAARRLQDQVRKQRGDVKLTRRAPP